MQIKWRGPIPFANRFQISRSYERASAPLRQERVLRVGSAESKHWVGNFPGIGAIYHEKRYEVENLAKAGCHVVGIREIRKPKINWKLIRHARELLRGKRIVAERRALLHLLNDEVEAKLKSTGVAPRLSLIGSSFAFWSITQIAKVDPQVFANMKALVGIAPGFGSNPNISIVERAKRNLGANQAMRETLRLTSVLREVLERYHISVTFLVPLAERVVDNRATEEAFDRLGPNVQKTAVLFPELEHDPFKSDSTTALRRYAFQTLRAACQGEELPQSPDQEIKIVRNQGAWGI